MSTSSAQFKSKAKGNIYQDKKILIIVSITMIAILPLFSISPILPSIATELNILPQKMGLIMAAFLIPVALGTPILGVLADRFGFKQVLIPSLLVFALGGVLCSFAPNFHSLIEWRILQGLGAASLESLVLSIIGGLYTGKKLTAAMAVNATAIGVGSTIYPPLGGALADISWRYTFGLSLLAIPVALLVMIGLKIPNKEHTKKAQNFKFKNYFQQIKKSIQNNQVLGLFLAIITLFMVEFGAFYTFTPIMVKQELGASSAAIGMLFSTNAISLTFFAFLVGLFARRVSETRLIQISLLVFSIALLIIPRVHSIQMLIIPCVLIGIVEALAFPSLQASLAKFAPEDYRASFMSLNVTVQSMGRAIGPIFAGIIFGFSGMQGVCYIGIAIIVLVLALFSFLVSSKPKNSKYKNI